MQITSKVFMVRPVRFGFNEQTAVNNVFQTRGDGQTAQEKALREFDAYTALLRQHHIDPVVVQDSAEPHTPDSIFPNNWFTTHRDGTLVLYPMFAENRRRERKAACLEQIRRNFPVSRLIDLTSWEDQAQFLEGTGSMVLDRCRKTAYICLSPRSCPAVIEDFCRRTGYEAFTFRAADAQGTPIYHTNVLMTVCSDLAVVCLESILSDESRQALTDRLQQAGKKILDITFDQMNRYAANILEVRSTNGRRYMIMSTTAHAALRPDQLRLIESGGRRILTPDLPTIEAIGGGSARCMLAELM